VTERSEKAKAFQHNVKVGDIFNTSWGYDQTNVEFFEVVDVRGKHAILRQIGAASVDDGSGCERTVAQSGAYLEPRHENDRLRKPLRRLIQDGHIKIDDVRTAHPWGQRDAITGTIIGRAMHQTAAGWGH
jgi:hypothetical protein